MYNSVVFSRIGNISAGLLSVALASGQAPPQQKTSMAEQTFKNIRVLKGIPVDQFMATMGFFSASLGETCTDCHSAESGGNWEKYADDNPRKETARRMIGMMNAINKTYFGGKREITCYSCHRGVERPDVTPSLAELYGPPTLREPDELREPAATAASADQVLDKYIQALGGEERLARITSISAKGTYAGFDTDLGKVPVEVFAKSPGQSTTIVHRSEKAQNITTYDGRNGWIVMTNTALPVKPLSGRELDNAQLDAEMFFPAGIKKYLNDWRTGFPPITVDDQVTQVVQATAPGGTRVKLFFDSKSGLLVRVTRFANTVLGLNPSQVDYSDYRDLGGVKVPFHWTLTWTDGRSEFDMTDVQTNVGIDAAKFGEAVLPKTATP